MKALFEIGKELGELRTRMDAFERKKCGCSGKAAPAEDNPTEDEQAVLAYLKENHDKIAQAFNNALAQMGLPKVAAEPLVLRGFRIGPPPRAGERYRICCVKLAQLNFCCDDAGCTWCNSR